MKKVLFALVVVLQAWLGSAASAAPCADGSLDSYQALGAGGCSIGNLTFSNFGLLTEPTAATPFMTIRVVPVINGALSGFSFVLAPSSAVDTALFENLIAYRVLATGATIDRATIELIGFSASGDGGVTNVQNLCLGGFFGGGNGVSGCTGTAVDQTAIAIDGFEEPSQTASFLDRSALAVVTDIAIDGGGNGNASLTSTTNLFRSAALLAVPEPSSFFLIGAGLLAFAMRRSCRRRFITRFA